MTDPWKTIPPEARLRNGLCSDCGVAAIPVADGSMKICPHCYSVLWHRDYEENQRKKQAEAVAAAARIAQRRVEKERLKQQQKNQKDKDELDKSKHDEAHNEAK